MATVILDATVTLDWESGYLECSANDQQDERRINEAILNHFKLQTPINLHKQSYRENQQRNSVRRDAR